MMVDIGLVASGLVILLAGASLLVRSASHLAAAFGLSPVIIGATVVAFGTSAPEFVVSVTAAVDGSTGLAVGNVFGSNIMNAALVSGIAATFSPINVDSQLLRREMPALGIATALVIVIGIDGAISRPEGMALFVGLIAFVGLSIWKRPSEHAPSASHMHSAPKGEVARDLALVVAAVAALAVGSDIIVRGAVGIARVAGLSDLVIGATVVAVGTGLPELTTTLVAAIHRHTELAIANVVGSNIFNLLGVLGLAAATSGLPISSDLYHFEIPALAISTLALLLLAWQGRRINRGEGVVLLLLYFSFISIVLVRGSA